MDKAVNTVENDFDNAVQTLVGMGFSREKSIKALMHSEELSIQLATNYLLNEVEDNQLINKVGEEKEQDDTCDDQWEDVEENYKMVFVVNSELNMSIGKTAAQVAHGCLGLYRDIQQDIFPEAKEELNIWAEEGQKKIVVSGKNTEQLKQLQQKAKSLSIPAHLIQDAGHTEVAPGSVTVLAVFGPEDNVNKITGSLRLLK